MAEGTEINTLSKELESRQNSQKYLFFLSLNICHSCRADTKMQYSGANIDELCLLNVTKDLRDFGFFKKRDIDNSVWVESAEGEVEEYKLLRVFPFS